MDDVHNNINNYNPKRNRKIEIVFDDVITDINANKKSQAIVRKIFNRCRKLNIFLLFIAQSNFLFPKISD